MSTIIRRDPNDQPGRARLRLLLRLVAAIVAAVFIALLVLAWDRGGPRPMRDIAVPLAAPAPGPSPA